MSKVIDLIQSAKNKISNRVFATVPYDWRQEFATAKFKILEQNLQEAMRFLRRNHVRNLFYRHKLPWFVILGAENSGKTHLLAACDLGLISTNNQPLTHISPTAYCDWWFGKEAVFLDSSGTLLMPQTPDNDSHIIWTKFTALLNRWRRNRPADGIILCIDLCDFFAKNRTQRQLQIDIFLHRIQCLTKYNPLPIFIVFTKCDQLPGFTETFHALSPEDSQQLFGITLPHDIGQQNISQQLEEQFKQFLGRLNGQLFEHLHREHNLEKRGRIKEFPLHIEAQKFDIIHLASQLHSSNAAIAGIYFTSSLQNGKISDALSPLLAAYGLPSFPQHDFFPKKKSFFIHELLKKVSHSRRTIQANVPFFLLWRKNYFYGIPLAVFGLLFFITLMTYSYNKNTLIEVQSVLKQYHENTMSSFSLESFLPGITALQTALTDLEERNNFFTNIFSNQTKQLQINIKNVYQQALKDQFAPYLKQTLTSKIQNSSNKPQDLFETLKIYLMLSDSQHLDQNFVIQWYAKNWSSTFPQNPKLVKQLKNHLAAWLKIPNYPFIPDTTVIQGARQSLSSLSLSELVYLSLQDKYGTKSQTISIEPFNIKPILNLYSQENFANIYNNDIPKLARQLATGDNWVLALKLPGNLAGPLTEQLIQNLRNYYIQNYAQYWLQVLNSIKMNRFENLAQIKNFAESFTDKKNLTLPLLAFIDKNIQPVSTFSQANELIKAQQQLHTQLTSLSSNAQINKLMRGLNIYLTKLVKTEDPGLSAIYAAKQRMMNNGNDELGSLFNAAKQVPEPLNQWADSLATSTWHNILVAAQNHINLTWMTKVLPIYQEKIKNHYPLQSNSTQKINTEDFIQFFGPNGIIDSFIKQNLAAFIDNSELYWKWKNINNEHLNIPQNNLEMLDRGGLIQKMFFADNSKTANVKFSISPNLQVPPSKNIILEIDGQAIDYYKDFNQLKNLNWVLSNKGSAELYIVSGNDKKTIWKESGAWALFKLLAHAKWINSSNSQQYDVSFMIDGTPVTYQIIANQAINPFIQNLLNDFKCPDKL